MDIKDYHLQSPIRSDERKLFTATDIIFGRSQIEILKKATPTGFLAACTNSERLYGRILGGVYAPYIENLKWVQEHLPMSYEAVKIVAEAAVRRLGFPTFCVNKLPESSLNLFSCVSFWEDVRNNMQLLQDPLKLEFRKLRRTIDIFSEMFVSPMFLLVMYKDTPYVFDYLQVTRIVDTLWARVNVFVYNELLPESTVGRLEGSLLVHCYRVVDRECWSRGNDIYNGIKSWEPLLNGVVIDQYDVLKPTINYFEKMKQDARDGEYGFMASMADYVRELELEANQLSELLCCFRHFGHPMVNEEAGCAKVLKIVRNLPTVDPVTAAEVSGALKQQFVASFITLKNRWPLIINPEEISNPRLKHMVQNHVRHANLYGNDIPATDRNELRFGKELEFDYYDDYTELIDDKSIAPKLSEFRCIYSRDILGYHPGALTRDRRLLKALLEMPELSIRKIIRRIEKKDIPIDWRIILRHAKERELKIEPRLFCLLPLEIRMYFSATEKKSRIRYSRFILNRQ